MTPSTSDEKDPTMHPRRQFACDDEAERDKWVGHLEAMVADAQALAREDHGGRTTATATATTRRMRTRAATTAAAATTASPARKMVTTRTATDES